MNKKVDILGVKIDAVSMEGAMMRICGLLDSETVHQVYTPNAEIVMHASTDEDLKEILNGADLLLADGAGIVLASRILGTPLPEKVSGIDIINNIFRSKITEIINRKKFYFLGGKPGIAEQAANMITAKFPDVLVCGCRHGYFSASEDEAIVKEINSSGADFLLVALGAPKQEKWIHTNKDRFNVRVCMGVGGSLDVFAGKAKLAPEFFRNNGLEWFYRLVTDPRRIGRMLKLPLFMMKVIATSMIKRFKRDHNKQIK
jgi:N-acetylglucosaminyldiphosphoundecaprenol N-acetyl-beta-D-mannosaminyltransferase